MVANEEADAYHQASKDTLESVKEQVAEENAGLIHEKTELLEQVEVLENEREQAGTMIDPKNLAIYAKLRETHRGVAVIEVADRTCAACGSALSASMAQAVRSQSKITFCESCRRILYSK